MTNLNEEIKRCLRMFGPCNINTIKSKLDLVDFIESLEDIESACEELVKSGMIKEATGFNTKAYKI